MRKKFYLSVFIILQGVKWPKHILNILRQYITLTLEKSYLLNTKFDTAQKAVIKHLLYLIKLIRILNYHFI